MGCSIQESFAEASPPLTCGWCARKVRFHDKISDGRIACLSCSYKEGFKPGDDCLSHPLVFDPGVPEIRIEMIRIARLDIARADAMVCSTGMIIPEDLFDPLKRICAMHGSNVNEEIVAALGWYCSMVLKRAAEVRVGVDAPGGTISSGLPDEISSGSAR